MYFIEQIVKFFLRKKPVKNPLVQKPQDDYSACSHIFMPIDSTGKYLACSKCGYLIENSVLNDIPITDSQEDFEDK